MVTKKSWSSEDVRINIDKKRMNNQLILPFFKSCSSSKDTMASTGSWFL